MTNKKRKVESEGRVVTKQIEPTIPIDNVNASYCATLLLDTLVKQLWQNTLSKTLATLDGVGKNEKTVQLLPAWDSCCEQLDG